MLSEQRSRCKVMGGGVAMTPHSFSSSSSTSQTRSNRGGRSLYQAAFLTSCRLLLNHLFHNQLFLNWAGRCWPSVSRSLIRLWEVVSLAGHHHLIGSSSGCSVFYPVQLCHFLLRPPKKPSGASADSRYTIVQTSRYSRAASFAREASAT